MPMRLTLLALLLGGAAARPLVRNIKTQAEFTKLMKHHKEKTGLPVIVDFYSDGCGPCRQMAPIYKRLAKELKGKAVFTKVDVNWNRETSGLQQIRSMPTFQFYLAGKKRHQFSGGDPNSLDHWARQLAKESEKYDVEVTKEDLVAFYAKVNPESPPNEAKIEEILAKAGEGGGPGHYKLVKKLHKKYDDKPVTQKSSNRADKDEKEKSAKKDEPKAAATGPTLEAATIEELQAAIDRKLEAEAEKREEAEEEEAEPESPIKAYAPGDFPERVTIVGGGPAGLAAAIYASRAGLRPVVVAPPMGGQLQGKGVMVENYPAVMGVTGPSIVFDMQKQAAEFGTTFEQNLVESIDFTVRPFVVKTNFTTIRSHALILATGADSNWLGVPGELEYRGGGVSSCATCDGFLYKDQEVLVIGGGDTAMEDALVLARTSSKVTVIHRRDSFRASHVLAQRVAENDRIVIKWNRTVESFGGKKVRGIGDDGEEGTGEEVDTVTHAVLKNTVTGETEEYPCTAAFVAIGHSPNTQLFDGLSKDKTGYLETVQSSTITSIKGVFAAGDVADKVYRQAITSAGSGAMAALDAERWLSEEGIGDEAAEFEAELLREMMEEVDAAPEREATYYETYKETKKEDEAVKSTPETPKAAPAQPDNSRNSHATGTNDPDDVVELDAEDEDELSPRNEL